MPRLMLVLALAALSSLMCTPADRAGAIVPTGPHGMGAAIDDIGVAEQAHCRPGRRHHRVRPYDGCYTTRRRAPVIVQPSPPPTRQDGGFGSLHEW